MDNNRIERIEGLEGCPNLEWLDLSFNSIKVIENIEHLSKLTDLSLQSNQITTVEGLTGMPDLSCLSMGDNSIKSMDGLLSLRPFTKLKLVSFTGNPIVSDPEYRAYAVSHIPSLVYLDYRRIPAKERAAAHEQYQAEIIELEEKETIEKSQRDAAERDEALVARHIKMNIHGVPGLMADLLVDPETAKVLVVPDFKEAVAEYKQGGKSAVDEFTDTMTRQYDRKLAETGEFDAVVRSLVDEAAYSSRKKVRVFTKGYEEAKRKLAAAGDDVDTIESIVHTTEDAVYDLEAQLLELETVRQEQADEFLRAFEAVVAEVSSASLEAIQVFFSNWRTLETSFYETTSAIANNVSEELANGTLELTRYNEAAVALLKDRVGLNTAMQGAHDNRGTLIDKVEDDLLAVERAWARDSVGNARTAEDTRNRVRVSETYDFVQRVEAELEGDQED